MKKSNLFINIFEEVIQRFQQLINIVNNIYFVHLQN